MICKAKLSNSEAAEYLGVSPNTLVTWRCTKRYAIPYVKVGRKVFYFADDLRTWLDSRRVSQ
jgi:excisionase family DNA binding protein